MKAQEVDTLRYLFHEYTFWLEILFPSKSPFPISTDQKLCTNPLLPLSGIHVITVDPVLVFFYTSNTTRRS